MCSVTVRSPYIHASRIKRLDLDAICLSESRLGHNAGTLGVSVT